MTGSDLREFAELLYEEARSRTDSPVGTMFNGAFVEAFREYLVEDGSIEDIESAYCRKQIGRSVAEAYGYGLQDEDTVLDVIIAEHGWKAEVMRKAEVQRAVRRAQVFVEKCRTGLYLGMEETDPAYPMAKRIHDVWPALNRVRIFLFTDARVTVDSMPPGEIDSLRCTYEVWDIARLHRLASSGRRSEETVITLDEFGGPLTCLAAPGDADYQCFLAVLPGALLAELYERHGARLLQRNVRAFLQARGKVNKGIGETVRENPGRFLAYNNGVSATATAADTEYLPDGSLVIASLTDLQIVNGGQTTASLHRVWLGDPLALATVRVPAKITVVRPELLDDLVPRISRYANSQNAIKEADFEANSPYHVELQELSRSEWAPAPEGSTQMTRWYYERVRGQYQVDLGRARVRHQLPDFRRENPVGQKFGKTDVARYELTHLKRPHDVVLGAEKCFRLWTEDVVARFDGTPDRRYFREVVAKLILFEHTRKIIQRMRLGGYLGPTTAYTVALMVDRLGEAVDLERIWRAQGLPQRIADLVPTLAADVVRPLLVDAPGSGNVGEWCKKVQCWERVRDADWHPN
ncbi:AIPR family protein [Kitasatospora sp. NPDC048194]|uniref:AIPR family protein n=1 Tax=Kitasatospora sp. NPDC048194 TaxID=3364045 RepID=UPI003721A0B2